MPYVSHFVIPLKQLNNINHKRNTQNWTKGGKKTTKENNKSQCSVVPRNLVHNSRNTIRTQTNVRSLAGSFVRLYVWDIKAFSDYVTNENLYRYYRNEWLILQVKKKNERTQRRGGTRIAIIFVFNFNLNPIPMLFHFFKRKNIFYRFFLLFHFAFSFH